MGKAQKLTREQLKRQAQDIDLKFKIAYNSGDLPKMEYHGKQLIDLLHAIGENWNDMRMARDQIREVQEEILRNAPTIRPHIIRPAGDLGSRGMRIPYRFTPPARMPARAARR